MDWTLISQHGPTVVVVALFIWHLRTVRKAEMDLIQNHMRHETDAMEKLREAIVLLIERLKN